MWCCSVELVLELERPPTEREPVAARGDVRPTQISGSAQTWKLTRKGGHSRCLGEDHERLRLGGALAESVRGHADPELVQVDRLAGAKKSELWREGE